MAMTIRAAVLLAGIGAAAVNLAALGAQAQVRDLDQESSDVRLFQGEVDGRAAVFQITVPANTTLQIDAIARDDFDPMMRVLNQNGVVIAQDDDGGEDLNPRVYIPAAGEERRITIEVDGFAAEWSEGDTSYGGAFDLRLSPSEYAAPQIRTVTYGARETGTFMGEEHLFTMQGQAGQMVEIALVALNDELDPTLELRDAAGEVMALDDDGGEGLNALLRHRFTDDGTYTIVADVLSEGKGDYRLRVRDMREVAPQAPLQVIDFDSAMTGELARVDDETGEETLLPTHIDYQLSEAAKAAIRAGDGAVEIHMRANQSGDPDFGGAIDSYIELGFETPLGFTVAQEDDDGGEGSDALLAINLSALSDKPDLLDMLRIRARSFGGVGGGFILKIEK
ncbi:hypothetical protein [Aurantiacibacter rhizosphaerae]|uniref:Peptidase C-terminal archaeal/bacterial domain-containing protein n=1 Tax=Aurantiacibacter rhizosphaerae TaxID=2691582 RepID=A0A844XFA5_9SPHN|nr:hypothetical protein [Aurantiacibacter rhizosphaerae]MWV28433.1 hypothetical protein [Aurantiacibacter rhizosphaerae]